MNYLPLLEFGLLGLIVSVGLIPLIRKHAAERGWVRGARDVHHTHRVPVPRLGGMALAAAFLVVEAASWLFFPLQGEPAKQQLIIVASSLGIFAVGIWDDVKPLGARRKLFFQLAIASAVYFLGIRVETFQVPFINVKVDLGIASYLVTVLWLVSLTNLINLVDGVDGLAGGICLMLMGLLAYVGHQTANLHLLAAGMVGALAGFLWFNFPPARIYLGDGGAYFLGFLIGIVTIVSSQKGTIMAALLAPLFVLALPILDTSLAILRRGLYGLPIFRPDRRHIHHRLLEMGISRRGVVLGIYAFTAIFLLMGFAAFWSKGHLIPNLMGLSLLVLLVCAGRLNFSREWFAVGRILGNSLQIRDEIQYALSLTNWLAMEGTRALSVEGLWQDFLFAARKLGFTGAKLTLEDGERVWQSVEPAAGGRVLRSEPFHGEHGVLELWTVVAGNDGNPIPSEAAVPITDQRVFDLVAELLAEGWLKAARHWRQENQLPIRFAPRTEPAPPPEAAVPAPPPPPAARPERA